MKMKVCVIFLLLSVPVALVYGQYIVNSDCPKVVKDPSKSKSDCTECLDCGFSPGYKCCPNECGGHSCKPVTLSCRHDDEMFMHGDYTGSIEIKEKNECSDCFCENGKDVCIHRDCDGAIP